jgi:hypothetical protein
MEELLNLDLGGLASRKTANNDKDPNKSKVKPKIEEKPEEKKEKKEMDKLNNVDIVQDKRISISIKSTRCFFFI